MALGFYEQSRNGHRILAHGGDTDWFHSDLYLILDADVGLFLSMNSAGRPHLAPRRVLFEEFMDRYFPANAPEDSAAVTALEQANELAGLYKVSRRFETNLLALGNPFAELKFGVDRKDMTVYSKTIKKSNGQPRHFREVAPMLFRAVDGPEQLYLAADPRREGKLLFIDYPFLVFEPVTGVLENRTVNIAVLGFSLGVIVLTLLGWPIGAMVRRHFGRSLNLSPGTRRLRTLVFGVCVLDVAFCAGMVAAVARLESAAGLGPRGDLWLHLLQGLGLLGGAGALIAVANSIVSWLDRDRWFWTKIWYTMVAMGCAGLFGFLFYWHVFNFNLRY